MEFTWIFRSDIFQSRALSKTPGLASLDSLTFIQFTRFIKQSDQGCTKVFTTICSSVPYLSS
ncbi:hypothetical protein LINGRAHAP2_LOCUS31299 [Linum grandiflorum]